MIPLLDLQMDDSMIEFQIGRVNGNIPKDLDPTAS